MTGSPAQFIFKVSGFDIGAYCRFTIYDSYRRQVAHFNSSVHAPGDCVDPSLGPAFVCEIAELALSPGRYWVNVAIHDKADEMQDHVESAASFDVEPGSIGGRLISPEKGYGIVCLPHLWKTGVDDG
jgi:lipopolysaccharide transport system ATP-binding protein